MPYVVLTARSPPSKSQTVRTSLQAWAYVAHLLAIPLDRIAPLRAPTSACVPPCLPACPTLPRRAVEPRWGSPRCARCNGAHFGARRAGATGGAGHGRGLRPARQPRLVRGASREDDLGGGDGCVVPGRCKAWGSLSEGRAKSSTQGCGCKVRHALAVRFPGQVPAFGVSCLWMDARCLPVAPHHPHVTARLQWLWCWNLRWAAWC